MMPDLRLVRRRNSCQRSGSWLNHFRSLVLGSISFIHSSIAASVFFTPRGHSRSIRIRLPSSDAGGSWALLSLMWSAEILLLIGLAPGIIKSAPRRRGQRIVFIWHTEV